MTVKILKNGRMFDGQEKQLKNDVFVVIEEEKITKVMENVSENNSLTIMENYPEAQVYDLEGNILLPGLIDSHIHLDQHGMADTYDENLVEDKLRSIRAAKEMENTLWQGFTTVRNAGSVNWIDLSVKEAVEQKIIKGPRILACGKILCITSPGSEYFKGLYEEVDGYDGFKLGAREQLKRGADLLKIMATGAIMNPGGVAGATQPDVEEIRAVVEEADKLNKKVASHAHGAEGIKNSIRAGVHSVEHGTFADKEAIEMLVNEGVYYVPTLAPDYFMNKHGKEGGVAAFMVDEIKKKRIARLDRVKRALDAGVKIATGSDAGTPYNFQGKNAYEMVIMVKEGLMTAAEALISGTKISAQACDLGDEIGTIEEGKLADLIVVKDNPLEDIETLTNESNILTVMKEGEIMKNIK
ncbi:metal-dependent hydrolase family protein [Natranaerofaba carboxydovora]|uniref:metal-dependent hydrolase family protein n=1 Tax=Natranaerofaba carboxydovora TaxID=2742683 RepID=UPI001F1327C7|nr:amidohydrolase family protein [Natranaerofaba carboxydovora]UMZ73845.1 Amidohydrolase family protein [Natranaerofaba carboxydovora]